MRKIIPHAFAALALALSAGAALAQAPATPAPAAPAAPAAPVAPPVDDFLARNAKEPGVVVLPSGLQYKVTKAGDPKTGSPKTGDVIKVHYEGSLTNGAVFDSSYTRGKPMLMQLYRLVPAWMEALPLMHTGDEWTIWAPPSLGYGDEGAGPIPPGSVLIFKLTLLGWLSAD
jgi:FKBP-type peptidyl-prolyl cis-trans isomerase